MFKDLQRRSIKPAGQNTKVDSLQVSDLTHEKVNIWILPKRTLIKCGIFLGQQTVQVTPLLASFVIIKRTLLFFLNSCNTLALYACGPRWVLLTPQAPSAVSPALHCYLNDGHPAGCCSGSHMHPTSRCQDLRLSYLHAHVCSMQVHA